MAEASNACGLQGWDDVTALILAGGLGTRLRTVVAEKPKCLAEVNGQPFLAYQLDRLAAVGLTRVCLCTGFLGDQVVERFGDRYGPLAISYSRETEPLGTGGAIRMAIENVVSPFVLVLNGDSLCDCDLNSLLETTIRVQGRSTMVLVEVADAMSFGRVEWKPVSGIAEILSFREKGRAGTAWINAGIYLLSRESVCSIPSKGAVSLEHDVFPGWVAERSLWGCLAHGGFLDIGTPEAYAAAAEYLRASASTSKDQGRGRIRAPRG